MERKDTLTRRQSIVKIVQFATLLAFELIIAFTPLGTIQIGPVAAGLHMIPVVLAGILMGPLYGGLLGLITGLLSFIVWTFMYPSLPSAILFTPWHSCGDIKSYWTLVICFIPRILGGVTAGYLFVLFKKIQKKNFDIIGMCVSAVTGSTTTSLLVLFGTYFLWGAKYTEAMIAQGVLAGPTLLALIGTTLLMNAIPEAVVAGIVSPLVAKPIFNYIIRK